jgi:molybdopterin molybdotransferase
MKPPIKSVILESLMLEFSAALKKVLGKTKLLPGETVPLSESLGRVLAGDIRAKDPVPPFRKSTMDGYAVIQADLKPLRDGRGVELEVIEDIPAGRFSHKSLKPGQAVRIMTGAPLPRNADCVVMVEDTEIHGRMVRIKSKVRLGENTGEIGEDVRKGDLVLTKGQTVDPAGLGMMASLGLTRVKVGRRPKVAVLVTGDELVEAGEKPGLGQIRNSNGPALVALARQAGAEVRYLGIARDRKFDLKLKIGRAEGCDILVLSGGVSVGDYDLVKDQLREFGVRPVFWKVRIKPGKPLFFGVKAGQLVFGLPGNPVSAMLTFALFVKPALDKMTGKADIGLKKGRAVLQEDMKFPSDRRQFLRAILEQSGPVRRVRAFANQKSGVLRSMVGSNAVISLPPGAGEGKKGGEVEVLELE